MKSLAQSKKAIARLILLFRSFPRIFNGDRKGFGAENLKPKIWSRRIGIEAQLWDCAAESETVVHAGAPRPRRKYATEIQDTGVKIHKKKV
jgi:hypothetical protein